MKLLRLIPATWLREEDPECRVREGIFTDEQWEHWNSVGYNVYYLPNHPKEYNKGQTVDGTQINVFSYVFVDFDLKSNTYESKDTFLEALVIHAPPPSSIVDTGGGLHVYWKVDDLDDKSYLRLCRRLMRLLNTDEAVGQLYQLMRLPGSVNTKQKDNPRLCEEIYSHLISYTCEQLDSLLPPITQADEEYCQQHYAKTHRLKQETPVDDKIPVKFGKLIRENAEAKAIWLGETGDRSKADWRLGHLMFASGFTKDEAMSVLVNSAKALERAPVHRIGYAEGVVGKIWTHEQGASTTEDLSETVAAILEASGGAHKGTRFPCHTSIDNTVCGFRLGHVLGLAGGSGVGKTTVAMNMFRWFVERNPEYSHLFVTLEQPTNEIADRWNTVSQGDIRLNNKVLIMSSYDKEGRNRSLSLLDIQDHILKLQTSGRKIGVVVIDHVGLLKKQSRNGEAQGLVEVFNTMKSFAIATNTMVIMQSQVPREKAGWGDLELDKGAAYGGVQFEAACDFLLVIWQPLKRLYARGAPTVMAYKFSKIRHKKVTRDKIQEDTRYLMHFDPETEQLRELTEQEMKSVSYFNQQAIKARKEDKKTELIEYVSLKAVNGTTIEGNTTLSDNKDPAGPKSLTGLPH